MSFVISPSVVVNEFSTPLTHARIGYDNFVPDAVVTATSAEAEFPVDSVQRENTFERWQPTSLPATLSIDASAGAAPTPSYIGIAAHTLGSSGSTISLEFSVDNISWSTVETVSPADNRAIMIIFAEVTAGYWRLVVTGSTIPQIGVVYIGKVLEMQRAIYGGHTPLNLSRTTVKRPTKSDKGQWLGSSTVRLGLRTSYQWQHLTAAWYRENFDPFVKSARTKPFFICQRFRTRLKQR